ncbi:hypothetical protein Tco_0509567 [Tanacetum coccineum]
MHWSRPGQGKMDADLTIGYFRPRKAHASIYTEIVTSLALIQNPTLKLSGERPIPLTRYGGNRSLATHFMLAMEEECVMSIFDAVVIKEGGRDELLVVANLGMRCLNLNGKNRPTMKEVAVELETIRKSRIPSVV